MDNDVFEDFPSDQELSDVDNEAVLSDDEIAHVLGLMDVGAALPVANSEPLPVKGKEKRQSTDAVETTMAEPAGSGDAVSTVGHEALRQKEKPPRWLPEPEMSDFDRFLEDFTRQQAPHEAKVAALMPTSIDSPPKKARSSVFPVVDSHTLLKESSTICENTPTKDFEARLRDTHPRESELPLRWGVFVPDKMPVRRECGSVSSVLSASTLSPIKNKHLKSKPKLRVLVPSVAFLRTKSRRPQRQSNPVDKELSFRPTINKAYFRRKGAVRLRGESKEQFGTRMQKDIRDRQTRQQKRVDEKKRQEDADVRQFHQHRRSLVAKGSQAILERNGLWEETMDARLERLLNASHARPQALREDPSKKAKRKKALRDKEKAKTRACESLYKRGRDKLQRVRDGEKKPPRSRQMSDRWRSSSSRHTDELVRKRLEREVSMICSSECGSVRSIKSSTSNNSEPGESTPVLPAFVSFVEFSCALLYFGFVPDANTPCESDPSVTLLWHAWLVFAEVEDDSRSVSMRELKKLLEMVIVAPPSSTASGFGRKTQRIGDSSKTRLLKLFRVNYTARNRSRSASTTPGDNRGGGTNTRSEVRSNSSKTAYSLHGRPLRPHERGGRLDDLLAARHDSAQQRIEALRRAKQEQELAECTFKPRIATPSGSSDSVREGYKSRSTHDEDDPPETFERLYVDAFVRHNNSLVRSYRARIEQEEKCKKEMHISPTYVNGLTIEERLQKLHESLSNNALPVNFHEKIAEMRRAYASKAEDEREKQSRLEPAAHRFSRTKEGHTLVVPFTFATEERQHQTRQRVDHQRGSTVRTRSPHSKSTSALIRELRFEFESPTHGFVESCEEDGRAADEDATQRPSDLCIEVHVSPLETYQLCLQRDDDVEEATRLFAEAYNLTAGQRTQLAKHAAAQLEQLFDL